MSGAETARRPVVQRRIGGAEMALTPQLDPHDAKLNVCEGFAASNSLIIFQFHKEFRVAGFEYFISI